MKQTILILLLVVSFISGTTAQTNIHKFCGTSHEKSPWLTEFQQNPRLDTRNGQDLIVALTLHLVADDNGSGRISDISAIKAFCKLQNDYEGTGIKFFLKEIRNIDDSFLYDHSNSNSARSRSNLYRDFNSINTFIVDNPAGACGYAWLDGHSIMLGKNCLGLEEATWAHEMGHAMSLPHTFLGWERGDDDPAPNFGEPAPTFINGRRVELADGSNCSIAGDGFCDTPADYLSVRWTCDSNGESVTQQTDPTGEVFKSQGRYIMSYALNACHDIFSEEQIVAMRNNVVEEHAPWLNHSQEFIEPIGEYSFRPISPMEGETIFGDLEYLLEWEPVPNATDYYVQISRAPNFTSFEFNGRVAANTLTVELPANATLFWRITPFNPFDGCAETSARRRFRTTDDPATSVNTIEGLKEFQISPNPTFATNDLNLSFDLEKAQLLDIKLIAGTGQVLSLLRYEATTGSNQYNLPLGNLAPGLYFISLSGNSGQAIRKLVIQ